MTLRRKLLLGLVLAALVFLVWGVLYGEPGIGLVVGAAAGILFVLFGESIWEWLRHLV